MHEPLPPIAAVVQDLMDSPGVSTHMHQGVWHLEFTEAALVALVTEQRCLAWAAAQAGVETVPDAGVDPLAEAVRRRSSEAARRVREHFADHPSATVKGTARALGMDPKTVRKYRPKRGVARGAEEGAR